MSDETTSQEGTGTSAQPTTEGTDTTSQQQTPPTVETKPEKPPERVFTQTELNAIVRKAKEEERKALEQAKAEADMSAAEKEKARADKAEELAKSKDAQLRRLAILNAARDGAESLSLSFNPGALEDAYKLGAFDAIELDDEGNPQQVESALKTLQKSKPYLLKAAARDVPDLDADRRGTRQPGEMTDDEQAALKSRFRIG